MCVCVCACACVCARACACVCAHPPAGSNSRVPARCPGVQHSSDTTYPEIESDSMGKGLSPTRPPSTSDVGHKPGLLPVLLINLLQIRSSRDPLLGFFFVLGPAMWHVGS